MSSQCYDFRLNTSETPLCLTESKQMRPYSAIPVFHFALLKEYCMHTGKGNTFICHIACGHLNFFSY